MTHKERLAYTRKEHHKACKIGAVTVAVVGLLLITISGEHGIGLGLIVHVFGLYLAELI